MDIENLSIKISSDASKAVTALTSLQTSLQGLQSSLATLDVGGLNDFANGISNLANSLKSLSQVKKPDYNRMVKGLQEFEKIDSAKFQGMANSLVPFAGAINNMSTINTGSLNRTINALTRLANSNISSVQGVDFTQFGNSLVSLVSALSQAGEVSRNTTSLINALSKLANTGASMGAVTANLPGLSVALHGFMTSMTSAPIVAQETLQLTTAIAQLANAGNKTMLTASSLGILGTEVKKFMASMASAPRISRDTIQMTQALAQLASAGGRVGTATRTASGGITSMGNAARRSSKHITSFAAAIGKFYASCWILIRLLGKLKQAMDIRSSLTELDNVMNYTFGQYKDKLEDFTKTSIQQYGMSELTAKQIATRFQAMGVAMGYTAGKMADMSIDLTKLAGDMASFYDVAQMDVAQDLESIFTGQTRPLRQYGLDLTEATLKEYAMKNGLNANIDAMTQAEKAMLRYKYVMDNTSAAHNDFSRTSSTMHNQLVILKNLFQNLGATIGTAFINLLKPVVSVLNKIVAAVTSFAEKVVNALGVIFGWTIEIENVGITDAFGDAAEFADDLASGTGKAADNAKKLKQQLQGFDELNVLQSDKDSDGGSGGGSGSGAGAGGASDGGLKYKIKEQKGLFESEIDTLYDLGKYIGKTLTDSMNSIDWDSVYEGARNFGKGLANFLNGLISPDLFGALGRTIAGSINTVLYSTLSFAETFDWQNLGDSIATGINEFFKTTDFKAVGKDINRWVSGIVTALSKAVSNIDWSAVGLSIADMLSELDLGDLTVKLAKLALNIAKGIGTALLDLGESNPIAAAIIALFLGIRFTSKLSVVANSIASALGVNLGSNATGSLLGGKIISSLSSFFGTSVAKASLKQIGLSIVAGFALGEALGSQTSKLWAEIARSSGDDVLASYYEEYNTPLKGVIGLINEARTSTDGFGQDIKNAMGMWWYGDYYKTPQQMEMSTQMLKNTSKLFGIELGNALVNGSKNAKALNIDVKGLKSYAKQAWDEIKKGKDVFEVINKYGTKSFVSVEKSIKSTTESWKNSFSTFGSWLNEKFPQFFKDSGSAVDREQKELLKKTNNSNLGVQASYNSTGSNVKSSTSSMTSDVKLKFTSMNDSIRNTSSTATNEIINKFKSMKDANSSNTSLMKTNTVNNFSNMLNGAISSAKSLNTKSNEQFAGVKAGASSAFGSLAGVAKSGMSKASNEITRQNWNGAGTHLVDGLKIGISNRWNQGGNNGLLGTIVGLAKNLTSKLKSAFGIHSPSRVWRDEIGEFLPKGLELGIQDGEGSVLKTVDDFSKDITQRMANGLNNPFDNFNASMKSVDTDINGTVRTNLDNGNLASEISMGIASGMSTTQAEQNALLREQNELLTQLLAKDMGISADDIYNTVRRKNRQNYNQTGRNALVY